MSSRILKSIQIIDIPKTGQFYNNFCIIRVNLPCEQMQYLYLLTWNLKYKSLTQTLTRRPCTGQYFQNSISSIRQEHTKKKRRSRNILTSARFSSTLHMTCLTGLDEDVNNNVFNHPTVPNIFFDPTISFVLLFHIVPYFETKYHSRGLQHLLISFELEPQFLF